MWSNRVNRGVVGLVAAVVALSLVGPVWGTEPAELKALALPDRDVIVINAGGESLTSELVTHQLRTNRLEVLYHFTGGLPVAPVVNGDVITGVEVVPREDGFMLSLALGSVVDTGSDTVYRETVLDGGRTILEVFRQGSQRSSFNTAWLEEPAHPKPVEVGLPQAPAPTAPKVVPTKFHVDYDPASRTLTIDGAEGLDYQVRSLDFPPRVDVLLPGLADESQAGLVHKDLSGEITSVEVVPAKGTAGMVVRANLTTGLSLVNQRQDGDALVLTFGKPAAPLAPQAAKPVPAASLPANAKPGMNDAISNPGTPPNLNETLSAGMGGFAPEQMAGTLGFNGIKSDVPSVEQILTMARADAQRYGKDAAGADDKYGTYQLPGFEGEDDQLSDVRVNLNAAGGFSLYQFLMFLSSISGISFIIDPYWVSEPFGTTRRAPPDPGFIPGEGGGPGFRSAGIFDPQLGSTGSVQGNFDNVPFDQALEIVLNTHNLKKVVFKNEDDPYSKPIILITSKERLEQEIAGQNEIDLYQLHYADPNQIWQILAQLNLLPSLTVGWYVYSGGNNNGGGNNGGGGGGGNNGGGRGGGGGGRGGGGNRNSISLNDVSAMGSVRDGYFDPLQSESPMQTPGGQGGGGGAGGGGGRGGGGGGQGGGGGGQGGNNGGVPIPTAKSGLVVMRGTRETLDTVQSLIAKIDKPPKQVAVKVKIYQVSCDPEEVWGLIRATAQKDRWTGDYGLGTLGVNILPKGGVMLDENYSAAFEFLQTERKAKVITETEVAVIDGFNATINNTRTRGQLTGTLVVTADGQVINQPSFTPVDAGMDLDFIPQIDDRGRVTLDLDISLSNFDGPEQRASANGQDVTFQPTVNTDLTTLLRLVDGQTAMIGGLTTIEDSMTFSGIPYISKLPIIGQFFGRTQKNQSIGHIFVTIQVNILDDK